MGSQKLQFVEEVDSPDIGIKDETCFKIFKKYINGNLILNIGCWVGNFEYLLNNNAYYPVSIEPEKKALQVAHNICKNTIFVQGSTLQLPFDDESFDMVTMWLVLEHLPAGTERNALSEIYRVLKKNGILIMSVPNNHWLGNILDPAYFLMGHRRYKEEKLIKLFKSSKFTVNEIQYNGGFFYGFSTILFLLYKYILREKMPKVKIIEQQIRKEHNGHGFAEIYLISIKK